MRALTFNEIITLKSAKQNFRDCYLVSALSALTNTANGRKILQQNIQKDGNAYCIRFNNVNGSAESYLVKQTECDKLVLLDKFTQEIALPIDKQHNPIIKAVEVAMNKLLSVHPTKKPIICRIPGCQEKFEFNKVSNFLEMFTGVKPLTLNESGLKMTLIKHKNTVTRLFGRMGKENETGFVFGTGYNFIFDDMPHCLTLKHVDTDSSKITVRDNRTMQMVTNTYEHAIKRYKFICGYFNEMLKQNPYV